MDTEEAQLIYELEKQFAEELSCQVKHKHSMCSVHVTHRVRDCVKTIFACTNGARTIRSMLERGDLCVHCEDSAETCWQLSLI